MKKIREMCIFITGVITGVCIAALILRYDYVKNIVKSVPWNNVLPILSLFAGALVPIYITFKSIKSQEMIKLRAELIKNDWEAIDKFRNQCVFMRTSVILDKSYEDMTTDYQLDAIEKSSPALRGLMILQSRDEFHDFNLNYQLFIEGIYRLRVNKIKQYIDFMATYILNLLIHIENIPDDRLWELSIIVKNDFFTICDEIEYLLTDYLDKRLYHLDLSREKNIKKVDQAKVTEQMKRTNLIKYRHEIAKLYGENN